MGRTPDLPWFLVGGGADAELIALRDWSETELGDISTWPTSLQHALATTLSSLQPMCVCWGSNARLLYNDAYRLFLGDKHPASLGEPYRDVWSEIWERVGPGVAEVLRGQPQLYKDAPLPLQGRERPLSWFTFTHTPIRGDDGAVHGFLSIATETTARVLAERAAADEIARLASLFEQAPSFMAVLRGPSHRIELANPGYMALVGHRPVLGKTVVEALPETIEQGYVKLLDAVYASGLPYFANGAQYRIPLEPGGAPADRFVDFVFQPIRDAAGAVDGIFVQGVDVTDIRRAQRALIEADERKNQFVAVLAHELRNPLAPVSNALNILDREPPAAMAARMRGIIRNQLTHLTRLVEDLLDISRVGQGKLVVAPRPWSVEQLCAEAAEVVRPAAEAKSQRLEFLLPADLPQVCADPARMVQVLWNLMQNASKYGRPEGFIRVRATTEVDLVRIDVEDDGTGMDPAFLPRVFDLFAQADGASERAPGGLGIGLALVKSVVELHGGRVEAFSPGLGRGSRFSVWLPAASASAAQQGCEAAH